MPITEQANPLKKLREVLMTCVKDRNVCSSVEMSRGESKQYPKQQRV